MEQKIIDHNIDKLKALGWKLTSIEDEAVYFVNTKDSKLSLTITPKIITKLVSIPEINSEHFVNLNKKEREPAKIIGRVLIQNLERKEIISDFNKLGWKAKILYGFARITKKFEGLDYYIEVDDRSFEEFYLKNNDKHPASILKEEGLLVSRIYKYWEKLEVMYNEEFNE